MREFFAPGCVALCARAALSIALLLAFAGPASAVPPDSNTLSFATLLGGSDEDSIRDVAVDANGNVYATGGTGSFDFPATAGAYDTSLNPGANGADFGAHDVWVARFAPDGTLVWATLLGGNGYDRAYAIEVDSSGVIVAGRAGINFPVTNGVIQAAFAGDNDVNSGYGPQDGFVARISLDGSTLLSSTYFGEAGRGFLRDIDVDASGNVYVALSEASSSIAHVTSGAYDTTIPGGRNLVVAKLTPDLGSVTWGSYLGGSGRDYVNPTLRVNDLEQVFVAGFSDSSDLPVTAGAFQSSPQGGEDLSVAGFSADGSTLLFATYLGGSADDTHETHGLALAPGGDLYLVAETNSTDFPTTAGSLQTQDLSPGTRSAFLARLSSTGGLVASTYLSSPGFTSGEGVALTSDGDVLVSGISGAGFPVAGSPLQSTVGGGLDFFLARLSPDLTTLISSTYIGGSASDAGRALAVGADGTVAVAGQSESTDFPTTDGSTHAPMGPGLFEARDGALAVFSDAGAPVGFAQSRRQRNCLMGMQGASVKVIDRKGRSLGRCISVAQKGELEAFGGFSTAEECAAADPDLSVSKKLQKLGDKEDALCLALPGQFPDFGYAASSAAGSSAVVGALGLVRDLLGGDIDLALASDDPTDALQDAGGARCQREVRRRSSRHLERLWVQWIRAERKALDGKGRITGGDPDAPVETAEELVQEVLARFSQHPGTVDRLQRDSARLRKRIDRSCGPTAFESTQETLSTLFPGACTASATDVDALVDCVEGHARCRTCLSIVGSSALSVDCDAFSGVACGP